MKKDKAANALEMDEAIERLDPLKDEYFENLEALEIERRTLPVARNYTAEDFLRHLAGKIHWRCKTVFASVELDNVNRAANAAIIRKMICLAAINGAAIQGGSVTQPPATEAKTLLARLVQAFKSKEVRCFWTGAPLIPRMLSGFQQLSVDRIGDQALSYLHPEQRVVVTSLWANYLFGSYDYAARLRLIGFLKANYAPDRADGAMSAYRNGHDN
ncbi:hypothetical protein HDU86_001175 [Geranomyces michiganensis]|nr:hypothetical protein HDU86_001175 [Geranomyces michiganensis]